MMIWVAVLFFLGGLAILVKGSDIFIRSAAAIAHRFGISEFAIGLSLVAIGTSLPEFGASVYASWIGKGNIALGNVIGSNVINITLVMGLSAVLYSVKVKKEFFKVHSTVFIASLLVLSILSFYGNFGIYAGALLLFLFAIYLLELFRIEREEVDIPEESFLYSILMLLLGAFMIYLGSKTLIKGATSIAKYLGVTETFIGLTAIAFGTSLPELAVSVIAAHRKAYDISLGNILGSNISNIFLVLGASSIAGTVVVDELAMISLSYLLVISVMFLIFMRSAYRVSKREGTLLLIFFILFLVINIMNGKA